MNTCGVLFTAQAAGRQMARFGRGGSIILIASLLGSVASKVRSSLDGVCGSDLAVYYRSLQLFHTTRRRQPCCRWLAAWHANWGRKRLELTRYHLDISTRSGSSFCSRSGISDTEIHPSRMTAAILDEEPRLLEISSMNPLGRIGRSDELRGIATWLASDASSFCTGSE